MAIRSIPKLQILRFVKECKMNQEWACIVQGSPEQARKFVHRMRVELSRLREAFRQRYPTRKPKQFKMLLRRIEELPDGKCRIVLMKSDEFVNEVDEELETALQQLGGFDK